MPARKVIVTNNTVVDNSLSGIMVENTASDVLVVNNISAFNGSHAVVGYDNESGAVLPGNRAHRNLAWDNSAGLRQHRPAGDRLLRRQHRRRSSLRRPSAQELPASSG